MLLHILFIILGIILLLKGGEWLVSGSSALARRNGVSELAIGLTIVAFGTSSPELIVNIMASSNNLPDIAFGNVIGSNNFNLFIILGLSGLLAPLKVQSNTVWKEIPFSLLAAIILFLLVNSILSNTISGLSRWDGFILIIFFLLFLFYVYRTMRNESEQVKQQKPGKKNYQAVILILLGLAGLYLGGRVFVHSAEAMARALQVSEKVIGVTIVAAGTSLPELVTSLVAVFKNNNDLAVGNIIGSNIFNIFMILGISSLLHPLSYNPLFNADLFILILGTIALFIAMFTGRKKKLDRWEAALFVLIYSGYMVWTLQ
jgi:cation:H+ antiporter